jgi:hypothetical protein
MKNLLLFLAALAAIVPCAACGDGDSTPGGAPGAPVGRLLPWKAGNRWVYRVTENGVVSMKTTVVEAAEPVGGSGPHKDVMANKVVTSKGTNDRTVSWQAERGDAVVRYREQAFRARDGSLELEEHWSPHKLHIAWDAERVRAGGSWLEVYEETKLLPDGTPRTSTVRDRWTVMATDEAVTVPAGTFRAVVLYKAGGCGQGRTS